jgi:hypothetical protein
MYRHHQIPLVVDEWTSEYHWCNGRQEKTEVFVEDKPVPVPLLVSQIQRRFSWHWTWVSVMRSRRLTAWTMARPNALCFLRNFGRNYSNSWNWSWLLGASAKLRKTTSSFVISYKVTNWMHQISRSCRLCGRSGHITRTKRTNCHVYSW